MPKKAAPKAESDSDGGPPDLYASSDSDSDGPPGLKKENNDSDSDDAPPPLCASSSNSDSDSDAPPALNRSSSDDDEDLKGNRKPQQSSSTKKKTAAGQGGAQPAAAKKTSERMEAERKAAENRKREEDKKKEAERKKEAEIQKKKSAERTKAMTWGRLLFRKWRAGKRVAKFTQGRWRMKQAQKKLQGALRVARTTQALWRGWKVRQEYRGAIKQQLKELRGFMRVWGEPVRFVEKEPVPQYASWEALKERSFDFCRSDLDDEEEKKKMEEEKKALMDVTAAVLARDEEERKGEEGQKEGGEGLKEGEGEKGQDSPVSLDGFVVVDRGEEGGTAVASAGLQRYNGLSVQAATFVPHGMESPPGESKAEPVVPESKAEPATPESIPCEDTIEPEIGDEECAGDLGEEVDMIISNDLGNGITVTREIPSLAPHLDKVLLTADTLKWYGNADAKVRVQFIARLRQLAAGERSRIKSKHLVGSKNFAIFETYLDQGHSAQRILWTESREKGGLRGLLVWCVARHKHVSKYMQKIDNSDMRRHRQLLSARSIVEEGEGEAGEGEDAMLLEEDTVLLDPMANTPLKIHEADIATIADLVNTESLLSLPLRLTSAEKDVIGKSGTVLVLGRSGTGKTICISKKMAWDREARFGGVGKQLFVCRSTSVCNLVQRLQGIKTKHGITTEETEDESVAAFFQMDDLVLTMLKRVAPSELKRFDKLNQIKWAQFSAGLGEKIYKESNLDALVVWTQITSFIKGSYEAVQKGRPLKMEEYMELGKDRVRLDPEQREQAYRAYEKYTGWCADFKGWDEGDRMLCVLGEMKTGDGEAWGRGEFYKVYVDEVQDLTQAHIAFLFYLSSSNSLFLAGDPAQSVEEGVDFRFQEVRRVAYELGMDVPQKPEQLLLNFRAHSGILDVAKAILDKLFAFFPGGSGVKLHSDKGLYKGPRPGLLQISEAVLAEAVRKNEGMVVIMPEGRREETPAPWGKEQLVLGIRESKGLEFPEVAVVDFFSKLPSDSQKRWKEMLQAEQEGKGVGMRYRFPELETQLKLLYTAVTRAQHSLYIIETSKSVAGTAFFRFLLGLKIAEEQKVLESERLYTVDEWVSRGLDMALQATLEEVDVEKEITWIQRASHCFGNAHHMEMQQKVKAQLQSAMARKAMQGGQGEAQVRAAVEATAECLRSGLWEEAARLCTHVKSHLPAHEQKLLARELLRPLQSRLRPVRA